MHTRGRWILLALGALLLTSCGDPAPAPPTPLPRPVQTAVALQTALVQVQATLAALASTPTPPQPRRSPTPPPAAGPPLPTPSDTETAAAAIPVVSVAQVAAAVTRGEVVRLLVTPHNLHIGVVYQDRRQPGFAMMTLSPQGTLAEQLAQYGVTPTQLQAVQVVINFR